MGESIVRLVQNPVLAVQLGEAGRKRVERDYDFNSLAERLLSVFSTLARAQRKTSLLKLLEQRLAAGDVSRVSAGVVAA
jgi:hypothetical protein